MSKTLYLECTFGISGDMFVGSLLDLGADEKKLEQALASLPVKGFHTCISRVKKSGLDACDFAVLLDEQHENHDHDMEYLHGAYTKEHRNETKEQTQEAGHAYKHEHRNLKQICEIIEAADMSEHAKQIAERIFTVLAEAEAKVHVRCLIDECANIGQIPNLEKLVATIRSREISACLVLQAQSQLKAIYKDNADTIIGNMDSRIFLGGSEPTTLKELNQALGKETIDLYNTSDTRGNSPSYGTNYQKVGHDLASVDELAVLDGGKCILQLRGVRPFKSDKYDLTQHPNYKLTAGADKKNTFSIEAFLDHRLKLKPGDKYEVVDADHAK